MSKLRGDEMFPRILLAAILLILLLTEPAKSEEDIALLKKELARMPLSIHSPKDVKLENFIPLLLTHFASNAVIRGVIIMPMASDYLYFFRDKPLISKESNSGMESGQLNIWQLLVCLEASTSLRFIVQQPFLIVYGEKDSVDRSFIKLAPMEERLRLEQHPPHTVMWIDRPWDFLEPYLKKNLGCKISPVAASESSWHFYRANIAGYELSTKELVTALCWSTKTKVIISRGKMEFSLVK